MECVLAFGLLDTVKQVQLYLTRKVVLGLKIIISYIENELQKCFALSLTSEFSGFLQQMLPPGRARQGALFCASFSLDPRGGRKNMGQ